jgi:methyltransferase (TIGR00027 family)
MIQGRPSRTAQRVALRRAAHQLFDSPKVLEDPLAVRIVGREAAASISTIADRFSPPARYMRAFMAVRARFAEDELAFAVRRGTTQFVILGAGLDTFAYRNPFPNLRVFEVDHPATQEWKRQRLAAAGEPFRGFFVPSELNAALSHIGYQHIEDLDSAAINARYFANRTDNLKVAGAMGRLCNARG